MSAPAARGHRFLHAFIAAGLLSAAGLAALAVLSRPYTAPGPAAQEPYNLMVEGFRSGHLWLAKEAPPGLSREPDPYLFAAYRRYLGAPWSLTDLSYYKGRLYSYFGAAPAVLLFWPWRALTGRHLHEADAVLLFTLAGLAIASWTAAAAWRRHFPLAGPAAGAAAALLLGSATTLPVFLARPGLFEVSISCAYAFCAAAVACLWNAAHRERGRAGWAAAASLAYGIAVASRPPVLFGAVILLLPAAAALAAGREGRAGALRLLLAALLPIGAVGALVAAYNALRFGDPLQFGHDYQLSGNNVNGTPSFSARFLWDNVRLYFLQAPRWHAGFPFVWRPAVPPVAKDHVAVEFLYGILPSAPALLAAALLPLPWGRTLARGMGIPALALLLQSAAVGATICLYVGATSRYFVDFMPGLALLAVLGLLAAEDRAAAVPGRPGGALLRAALYGAVLYTVAVAWLLAVALVGFYRSARLANSLLADGRVGAAAAAFDGACRMNPDYRGQADLAIGAALLSRGRLAEGSERLAAATREDPRLEPAYFNLGQAQLGLGRPGEAAASFSRAVDLDPGDAEAEENWGVALFRLGDLRGAIRHEEAALAADPSLDTARRNLELLRRAGAR